MMYRYDGQTEDGGVCVCTTRYNFSFYCLVLQHPLPASCVTQKSGYLS